MSGGRGTATFQRLIDGPGSVISLACAADAGVPEVSEALEEVARYDLPGLLADPGYQTRGLPALREEVARYYTDQGLPTSADEVLITTGAHQALVLLSEVYLRGASSVAVEAPSWQPCIDVFRAAGADLVSVPLDDEGIDDRRLATVLAEQRPSLLYVMPTFHNPAGVLMSDARRRRVAELAARHDVPVVEDNAYAGCVMAGDSGPNGLDVPPPLSTYLPAGTEAVAVESLKSVWGGLRIGWIRGPRGIVERCARRKALADLSGPLIEQAVAARLFPRLPEIVKKGAVERAQRCEYAEQMLTEQLPGWSWRTPDGGSSLWIALPEGGNSDVFAQIALRHASRSSRGPRWTRPARTTTTSACRSCRSRTCSTSSCGDSPARGATCSATAPVRARPAPAPSSDRTTSSAFRTARPAFRTARPAFGRASSAFGHRVFGLPYRAAGILARVSCGGRGSRNRSREGGVARCRSSPVREELWGLRSRSGVPPVVRWSPPTCWPRWAAGRSTIRRRRSSSKGDSAIPNRCVGCRRAACATRPGTYCAAVDGARRARCRAAVRWAAPRRRRVCT
ncbi:PLP-dependent aminotransferase family protein [Saccharomonospora sp. CUA-673]|uniref:aminotransferase-like domain-containing protein n=1 Tax=Saccharomonospora sp. CUA-673 TaxID=1904969 RepID=UPI003519CEF7